MDIGKAFDITRNYFDLRINYNVYESDTWDCVELNAKFTCLIGKETLGNMEVWVKFNDEWLVKFKMNRTTSLCDQGICAE